MAQVCPALDTQGCCRKSPHLPASHMASQTEPLTSATAGPGPGGAQCQVAWVTLPALLGDWDKLTPASVSHPKMGGCGEADRRGPGGWCSLPKSHPNRPPSVQPPVCGPPPLPVPGPKSLPVVFHGGNMCWGKKQLDFSAPEVPAAALGHSVCLQTHVTMHVGVHRRAWGRVRVWGNCVRVRTESISQVWVGTSERVCAPVCMGVRATVEGSVDECACIPG